MPPLKTLIEPLLDLCLEAGERIREHYEAPWADQFESKGDDSPLTRADLDSHAILGRGLHAIEPSLPILSEESEPGSVARRREWSRFWLVDPLDGTKEFLARTGEFTINIALVENGRAVLGLLFEPLARRACVGIPGEGAWRYQHAGAWTAEPIRTRALADGPALVVLASRRHGGGRLEDCLDWLVREWGEVERDNSGSALKFCQLATGEGDFYPRFSPCCEWDTAAGQALLEAAGGALLGLDGQPLSYNRRDTLLSPPFFAIADPRHALWSRLLAREEEGPS